MVYQNFIYIIGIADLRLIVKIKMFLSSVNIGRTGIFFLRVTIILISEQSSNMFYISVTINSNIN